MNSLDNLIDNNAVTSYHSSIKNCWIKADFGLQTVADITKIKYVPKVGKVLGEFKGLVVQASNDDTKWETLFSLSSIIEGQNTWTPEK